MAEGRIPVLMSGEVLGVVQKKKDNGKTERVARVMIPVPGDMPEVVDVRGWPSDGPSPEKGQAVSFTALVQVWRFDGRTGVSVRWTGWVGTKMAAS